MSRFAILCCLTASMIIPAKHNSHTDTSAASSARSAEVSSLTAETTRLQKDIVKLRSKEDASNSWNHYLNIAAVVLAGAFGITSWLARNSARHASENARPLVTQLAAAKSRMRDLQDQESQVEIATANARAEVAIAKAELERTEQKRLELLLNPRRLTREQQAKIGHACVVQYGRPLVVTSYALDVEGAALAEQLIAALRAAHFNVVPSTGSESITGTPETGVQVRGPAEDSAFVDCLVRSLIDIGHLAATANGPREGGTQAVMQSTPGGGSSFGSITVPSSKAGEPLPPGWLVTIHVGIKPVELLSRPN